MMKHAFSIPITIAALGSLGLAGCAVDYAAERGFGQSVSAAIQQQTIRPEGVGRDGVTPGLDGHASKATIDRYQKSYEQPQTLGNVMTLGVGGGRVSP